MFTGIIEEVGRITAVEKLEGGRRMTIMCGFAAALSPDQSVSVNGACQTVTAGDDRTFQVVAVEETLSKTTLGSFESGQPVNLERPLRPDGRLDGHIVQGHVDATGEVVSVEELEDSRLVRIAYDEQFGGNLIPVGSVAVDGISLTVARLDDGMFTVSIIPHTYEKTNAPTWKSGVAVNLEFDLIGKYVNRWMELRREG